MNMGVAKLCTWTDAGVWIGGGKNRVGLGQYQLGEVYERRD